MHLTLKREAIRPPGKNLLQQQELFDRFRNDFNHIRPHEALDMKTPSHFYMPSNRQYPQELPQPDYSLCDHQRKVNSGGAITVPTKGSPKCFVARALQGQPLGLTQIDENQWKLQFMDLQLGFIHFHNGHYYIALENNNHLSPTCPV